MRSRPPQTGNGSFRSASSWLWRRHRRQGVTNAESSLPLCLWRVASRACTTTCGWTTTLIRSPSSGGSTTRLSFTWPRSRGNTAWKESGCSAGSSIDPKQCGRGEISHSVVLGVQEVAQAVARQVEREGESEDGQAGPPGHPGGRFEELLGGVEHRAPARGGWLHAQPEEREDGFGDDRARDRDRGLDEESAEDVREDVPEHHAHVPAAEGPRALDVVFLRRGQHQPAGQPDVGGGGGRPDGHGGVDQRWSQDCYQANGQDQERE